MLHSEYQCFRKLGFFNGTKCWDFVKGWYIAIMKRTEDHLQAQIVKWWQDTYPARRADLFHVPNEAKRTPQEAGRMAALGLMPGVPDLIVHVGFNHFVPIEVKAENGRLSEAQKSLCKFWGERGTIIHVVRSVQEFQEIIRPWLQR
jgi:hypothetical protein